jgi:hypothetical protein
MESVSTETTEAMWAHHRAVFLDSPQGLLLNKKGECVVLNKEGECVNGINPRLHNFATWHHTCCQMQNHRPSCCQRMAFLDQILTLLKISLKTCLILVSWGSKLSPNPKKQKYINTGLETRPISWLQSIGRKFLVHPEGTLLSRISAWQRAGHVQKGLKFLIRVEWGIRKENY